MERLTRDTHIINAMGLSGFLGINLDDELYWRMHDRTGGIEEDIGMFSPRDKYESTTVHNRGRNLLVLSESLLPAVGDIMALLQYWVYSIKFIGSLEQDCCKRDNEAIRRAAASSFVVASVMEKRSFLPFWKVLADRAYRRLDATGYNKELDF